MLVIEDGNGISNANSYISLAEARLKAADYGIKLPADDTEAETALRQGYLNLNVDEGLLQGNRSYNQQTGAFPRVGMVVHNFPIDNNVIPEDIKLAQVYAAEAISGGYDMNSVDGGQELASFSVEGVYSESYQAGSNAKTNSTIKGVYNTLRPYTKAALGLGQSNYRTPVTFNRGYGAL